MISRSKREYAIPAKQDYYQPGGYPDCLIYLVDKYNNIYPQINWGEMWEQERIERLGDYNKTNKQMVLFI